MSLMLRDPSCNRPYDPWRSPMKILAALAAFVTLMSLGTSAGAQAGDNPPTVTTTAPPPYCPPKTPDPQVYPDGPGSKPTTTEPCRPSASSSPSGPTQQQFNDLIAAQQETADGTAEIAEAADLLNVMVGVISVIGVFLGVLALITRSSFPSK